MFKPIKRRKIQTPQAAEFLQALEMAKVGGSVLPHEKSLAEWRFIDRRRYECTSEEKRYLLEYELAREAEARGLDYRSTATWKKLFGSRFPENAFLSVEPAERRAILDAAFWKRTSGVPFFDFTKEWQGISYQFNYGLQPKYQAELDAIVAEARETVNIKSAEDGVDIEVASFMAELPVDAYDQSVAHVRLTIDFDYSDDTLKAAFAEVLSLLRRENSVPGKKDEVDAHLKQLAAARLHRIFGTVQAAQDYLGDCDFDFPYGGDAGWSKAGTTVRKLLGADVTKSFK